MSALRLALILLLLTGCVSTQPSAYQLASAMLTPDTLMPGSRWSFVLLGGEGQITATFVVGLSDEPIKTCDAGNYRRVEIVSKSPSGTAIPVNDPAYEIVGAALRIQLSTVCENGHAIIGGVTDGGFEGTHMAEVLIAPRATRNLVQRAYGVPLPLTPNTSLERTRAR